MQMREKERNSTPPYVFFTSDMAATMELHSCLSVLYFLFAVKLRVQYLKAQIKVSVYFLKPSSSLWWTQYARFQGARATELCATIQQHSIIFIPAHVHGNHWVVYKLDVALGDVQLYDSLAKVMEVYLSPIYHSVNVALACL